MGWDFFTPLRLPERVSFPGGSKVSTTMEFLEILRSPEVFSTEMLTRRARALALLQRSPGFSVRFFLLAVQSGSCRPQIHPAMLTVPQKLSAFMHVCTRGIRLTRHGAESMPATCARQLAKFSLSLGRDADTGAATSWLPCCSLGYAAPVQEIGLRVPCIAFNLTILVSQSPAP